MILADVYKNRRVVVCVGTGGVGKTTVAASLALAAAQDGRRVLVMTIDPSLRLAQALGLRTGEQAGNAGAATAVPVVQAGPGSLSARVLDVQQIFDALIQRRASSPEQAQSILNNRIYRHFSASMAGSHEYAAVEALWDAYNDASVDLIVLDTPPSQHAVDFLEAPERILHFLQGDHLVERIPGGGVAKTLSRRLFDLGGGIITKAVSKISGAETLQDVLAFLHGLRDMYDSFKERAQGVGKLLRQQDVAFVLVGAATQAQLAALAHFRGELSAHGIVPHGFVLNRTRPHPLLGSPWHGAVATAPAQEDPAAPAWATALAAAATQAGVPTAEQPALVAALGDEIVRAERDEALRRRLAQEVAPAPVWILPEMVGAADSLKALTRIAELLRQATPPQ